MSRAPWSKRINMIVSSSGTQVITDTPRIPSHLGRSSAIGRRMGLAGGDDRCIPGAA